MRKKNTIIAFFGIFALVSCLALVFFLSHNRPSYSNGVNLDIARKFYRPEAIKKWVDQVAENGGDYLQLHLSDDENVAVELSVLGQTKDEAYLKDGIHYNSQTKRPFLTKAELADIIAYASSKRVYMVADFDTPGHFTAAAELLQLYHPELANRILKDNVLDYESSEGAAFAKKIYGELTQIFKGQPAMVIGGDEFDGDQKASNPAYVSYVNAISACLSEKGFVMRIWNDTVLKEDLANFEKDNLQIIYWSLNGDANDEDSDWDQEANRYRAANRASLPDLQKAGFQVINANSYHLYSVPNQDTSSALKKAVAEEVDDSLKSWIPTLWNGTDHPTVEEPHHPTSKKNLVGSLYSIWSEEVDKLSDEEVVDSYKPALQTFFERAK